MPEINILYLISYILYLISYTCILYLRKLCAIHDNTSSCDIGYSR